MTYLLSKHLLIISLSALFVFLPSNAAASDPPLLSSPADNSIVEKSPKLVWEYKGECVESGSCFMAEVDNNADFSSTEKSTYTNSFSYSPQGLGENLWYWRVKAKDKSQKWSEWSQIYKFTISSQTPSPSASASIQTVQPSASALTPKKSENIFEVTNIPGEINSDQEFETQVRVKLTDKPNTVFYIKGAFKKEGSSNYFGETKVNSEWIKNNAKYSKQFKITTDQDGLWEGKIIVKPGDGDSGFEGSGDYLFRIAKYSESGTGPVWSNDSNIKINAAANPSANPEKIEDDTAEDDYEEVDTTASLIKAPSRNFDIKIASVAGVATKSDNISSEEYLQVQSERKANWLLIFSGFLVLLFGIGFVIFKIRKGKINAGL